MVVSSAEKTAHVVREQSFAYIDKSYEGEKYKFLSMSVDPASILDYRCSVASVAGAVELTRITSFRG